MATNRQEIAPLAAHPAVSQAFSAVKIIGLLRDISIIYAEDMLNGQRFMENFL